MDISEHSSDGEIIGEIQRLAHLEKLALLGATSIRLRAVEILGRLTVTDPDTAAQRECLPDLVAELADPHCLVDDDLVERVGPFLTRNSWHILRECAEHCGVEGQEAVAYLERMGRLVGYIYQRHLGFLIMKTRACAAAWKLDPEDLLSETLLLLERCLVNYRHSENNRLLAAMEFHVRAAAARLRMVSRTIQIPEKRIRLRNQILRTAEGACNDRTVEEIAAEMGLSSQETSELFFTIQSLDAMPVDDVGAGEPVDCLASLIDGQLLFRRIERLMTALPETVSDTIAIAVRTPVERAMASRVLSITEAYESLQARAAQVVVEAVRRGNFDGRLCHEAVSATSRFAK